MGTSHVQAGWNQVTSCVKGIAGRVYSLPGLAVGDKIVSVSRVRFKTVNGSVTSISSIAMPTIGQFTVSAANTVRYKGSGGSFPNMLLLVTWVDKDGSSFA